MENYIPARPFAKIAQQPWAIDLWAFLNRQENVIRMETAIELNRAPLEGVLRLVEHKFGSQTMGVENHSHREMVGHMIVYVLLGNNILTGEQNCPHSNSSDEEKVMMMITMVVMIRMMTTGNRFLLDVNFKCRNNRMKIGYEIVTLLVNQLNTLKLNA